MKLTFLLLFSSLLLIASCRNKAKNSKDYGQYAIGYVTPNQNIHEGIDSLEHLKEVCRTILILKSNDMLIEIRNNGFGDTAFLKPISWFMAEKFKFYIRSNIPHKPKFPVLSENILYCGPLIVYSIKNEKTDRFNIGITDPMETNFYTQICSSTQHNILTEMTQEMIRLKIFMQGIVQQTFNTPDEKVIEFLPPLID